MFTYTYMIIKNNFINELIYILIIIHLIDSSLSNSTLSRG